MFPTFLLLLTVNSKKTSLVRDCKFGAIFCKYQWFNISSTFLMSFALLLHIYSLCLCRNLSNIHALFFSDYNPFLFGNRETDENSYRKMAISKRKILIVNPWVCIAISFMLENLALSDRFSQSFHMGTLSAGICGQSQMHRCILQHLTTCARQWHVSTCFIVGTGEVFFILI